MMVNNQQALTYKTTQPNQFQARVFVVGKIVTKPELKGSHFRYFITLDPNFDPKNTQKSDRSFALEIVYNVDFGTLPSVEIGEKIAVCGDFINSFARAGKYPASPAGAIVHWVHYNPGNRQGSVCHPHGFIAFGSDLAGFDQATAESWRGSLKACKTDKF